MKLILLVILVITISSAYVAYGLSVDVNAGKPIDFTTFKSTFKKSYNSPTEIQKRKAIYESNLQKIAEINQQAKDAGHDTKFGVNAFSDQDPAEFIKTHTGYVKSSTPMNSSVLKHVSFVDTPKKASATPTSWDWRALKKVSPVKNQGGYCGSCWAFATASILETAYAIKYNTTFVPDLTEQELIDCALAKYNCNGCSGGDPAGAATFVATYGLMQDSYYPYFEFQNFFCYYDTTQGGVIQPKYAWKYTGTEAALTQVISQIGPVEIGMYVPDNSLQNYVSGIFTDPRCVNTNQGNHAVVIEGYGTQNGKDYWLVRNSWGADWGENGYFKLPRGSNYCNMMAEIVYFTF